MMIPITLTLLPAYLPASTHLNGLHGVQAESEQGQADSGAGQDLYWNCDAASCVDIG
jgi:hypothetical protein